MANNSQIGSSSHDPLKRSYSQIGLEVALAILISLMSFLGNLLVVYVVHKDSRLKSLTNIFIQNLALTDIAMATLHMPYWVISLYTGTWIFSETWCDFQALIEATLGIASLSSIWDLSPSTDISELSNQRSFTAGFSLARKWPESIAPSYGYLPCFLHHRHCTVGARWCTTLHMLSAVLTGKSSIFHMS